MHRTPRLTPLILAALLVACARPATPTTPPPPTPAAVVAPTVMAAPSATPVAVSPTVHATEPTAAEAGTPVVDRPAVVGAYVTSYLPGAGERPAGIAVLGARAYVANQRTHNVSIIAADKVEGVVPVGASPGAIVADAASGHVFVLNHGDSTISVIAGSEVVATWALPEPCTSLAVLGDRLWVGATQGGRIYLLSTGDGARVGGTSLDTSSALLAMAPSPDGATIYVASYNRTTALDVATLAEVARAELNSYDTLAVSGDGHRVYVNDYRADAARSDLVALDAATLEVVGRAPLPPDPAGALGDPSGERVYVASAHDNALLVLDAETLERRATIPVGLASRHLALDAASGRLFVANTLDDCVTVVDTATLAVTATSPLSAQIDAMDVDPATSTLYVAASSADRILAFGEDGLVADWYAGRHPAGVAVLPERNQVAVLLRGEARLALVDGAGERVAEYPTGLNPIGLTLHAAEERLYAGDLVLDLATGVTRTLQVPTINGDAEPPVRVTLDTRRGRAYAIAFNGVAGTNGGNVVTRIADDGSADPGAPAPSGLGVLQLLYDPEADRFLAVTARLTEYALHVSDAETLREVAALPLDRRPSAAALNPTTRHLWLALPAPDDASDTLGALDVGDTRLVARDTRTLGLVAEITIPGRVRSLTVDRWANLLYAAVDGTGDISIVRDVAMPAPPAPAAVRTPPPAAITPTVTANGATSTPAPTTTAVAATSAPTSEATTTPTLTPVPVLSPTPTREEPCRLAPDARLTDAYDALGIDLLGCPREDAVAAEWAWQPFEQGDMLWHGSSGVIYVFTENGGWRGYTDDWREGMPDLSCDAEPPEGLFQPVRGFGRIWCLVGEAREGLGWATETEHAVSGLSQQFDGGLLLRWDGATRLLKGDGAWITP